MHCLEQLKVYTNTKVSDVVLDLKLKALILDLIHHIDVVDQLTNNQASSSQCWTWQRQLRFYLVGDAVVARQVNSEFNYTYEYQGNTPKLVHTPLTDKCYLTLTQGKTLSQRFAKPFEKFSEKNKREELFLWVP
ncbi:hypothetical protein COOONC_23854, partial [Cooperia oncophora]